MAGAETRNRRGGHPGGGVPYGGAGTAQRYDTDPTAATDNLTVLRTYGPALTKRVRRNGSLVPYDSAKHFGVREVPAGSLDDLVAALDRLSRDPHCAVIRGGPVEGLDRRRVLRRKASFAPAPRRWLAADVDGVDEPAGLTFAAEPEAAAEYVRDHLMPAAFEGAACWWQATSSAGIKPGIRLRLWFWCDRPVADDEAKRWLADAPVDPSLYGPVALHYVAAPIVEPGARDPMARRQGVLDGDDVVAVPDLPDAPLRPSAAPVAVTLRDLDETERAAVVAAMRRSRLAAHIWRESRTYADRSKRDFAFAAGLVRGGCTSPEALAAALVALGEKHPLGSKCDREDYVARTVTAALATQREVARG